MLYDRILKRKRNYTVIPMKNMVTSEGVIFFGEDPGIICPDAAIDTELDHGSGPLSE